MGLSEIIAKRPSVITGLDMGASKVSAVCAEIRRDGNFYVCAQVTVPSRGILRGAIIDLNGAVSAVTAALGKIKAKFPGGPGDIYVNISGQAVKASRSRGMIPISMRGREVTKADMERCVEAAGTISLPFDREVIHKIVQRFSVDDQPWIADPIGLYASRLSCEVFLITADTNHIQNIYKCVNNAGYDVKEMVFSGLADGAALLEHGAAESRTIIADMGSSLTEISLFEGQSMQGLDIIPIGANDVKGDLLSAVEFGTVISRIQNMINSASASNEAISSIMVTGGMAFADGTIEYMEEKLARTVKMGLARDVSGEASSIDSVRFVTAIGLCRYAYQSYRKRAAEDKNIARNLSSKVVDLLNNYF